MRRPITCREELETYLAGDEIECLECGRWFRWLGPHLRRVHHMAPEDYRVRWGLPAGAPLAGQAMREARAEILARLATEGRLRRDPITASAAARETGRGERAPWERLDQAARAATLPRSTLPPGARRRDGRDADRAREYQRARRALLAGDPGPMQAYRQRWGEG